MSAIVVSNCIVGVEGQEGKWRMRTRERRPQLLLSAIRRLASSHFCLIMVRHQHHPCTAYLVTNHLFRVHYSTLRPCCRLSCSSSAHAHMSARHFPGSLNAGKGKSRPSHIPRYN